MVTPRFPPYRGGVEAHVYEVARRLVRDHDLQVEVLTTDLEGTLPRRDVVEGILVNRVPAWPRGADLYYSPQIYRRVARGDGHLIHCQGYHTLVAPLAMLAARRARRPYVVTLHSGGHSSRLRNALRPLQAAVFGPLLKGAEALVAVSRFEADLFERSLRLAPGRVRVIPNGADMPTGAGRVPSESDPNLILSVGRLERYKGHHRLIEALPAVRAVRPAARLHIVGSGPYEPELRALAEHHHVTDAVEIRGMPREELQLLLERASVVALLSEYESQGIAVYEALALGRRVVILESSALAELSGLRSVVSIRPEAGSVAVARALLEQLEGPEFPATDLPPLPTWDDCAAQLVDVYRAVLDRVAFPIPER